MLPPWPMNKFSLAFFTVVAMAACDKSKSGGAAATKALSGGAGSALAAIPAAADVVFSVNLDQIVKSEILGGLIKELGDKTPGAGTFDIKKECGIDPVSLPAIVTVGMDAESAQPAVWVVAKGVPGEKVMACAAKSEEAKKNLTIDGNFASFDNNGQKGAMFGTADAMYIAVGTDANDKAALEAMSKATAGIGEDKEFASLFGNVNKGAGMWFVALTKAAEKAGQKVSGFGSINFAKTIDFVATIKTPDKAKADEIVAAGNQAMMMAKGFTTKLEMKADGNDVKLDVSLSKENIEAIKGLAGGMLPGLGG